LLGVLGSDDYTNRLNFHIVRIKDGKPIYFPKIECKISFVEFVEASQSARFLLWLMTHDLFGPVNACSSSPFKLKRLIEFIERFTNKKAIFTDTINSENSSPYGIADNWYMNTDIVKSRGFQFGEIYQRLPDLIKYRF
jgi:nucleoside-diphosphate-sugar epimerase